MKIAHIGPPLARIGGPAGYLYQLRRAAQHAVPDSLQVLFPPLTPPPVPQPGPTRVQQARRILGRWKRYLLGPPQFARPQEATLLTEGGDIEQMLKKVADACVEEARESLFNALTENNTGVLFAHDVFCADFLLRRRQPHQQVWLMVHNPMPMALYLVWNWGVPERDWCEVLQFPDVQRWIAWELRVWRHVDKIILPCPEAGEELQRSDPQFADMQGKISYLLTGATDPSSAESDFDQQSLRRRWQLPLNTPVGLYVGNAQPYRGLDTVLASLSLLPPLAEVPGILAVAGPDPESLPRHSRLLPLGYVREMGPLLATIDFVINVNRFSLFDLSTIEATAARKPLLLHTIGGNKTFRDLGAGCVGIPDLNPTTIAAGLTTMFRLSHDQIGVLGEASRRCYETYLTPGHLWERHRRLYEEVKG